MKSNYFEKKILIDKLLLYASPLFDRPRSSKPGDIIKKLTEKERKLLSTMTSEDFMHRIK